MRKFFYGGLLLTVLAAPSVSAASQVYKCIASNGAITFSDSHCPSDSTQSTHHLAAPMTIRGLSDSDIQKSLSRRQRSTTTVTVIAEDPPRCGSFDPRQRRTDLVRKHVKSGMSQAEVESMFGKPIKQRSHNGTISATYRSSKGQQRSVRFNEHGCVP